MVLPNTYIEPTQLLEELGEKMLMHIVKVIHSTYMEEFGSAPEQKAPVCSGGLNVRDVKFEDNDGLLNIWIEYEAIPFKDHNDNRGVQAIIHKALIYDKDYPDEMLDNMIEMKKSAEKEGEKLVHKSGATCPTCGSMVKNNVCTGCNRNFE